MRASIVILTLLAAAALPPAAQADGLPVVDVDVGPSGVTNPGAAHNYVALTFGRRTASPESSAEAARFAASGRSRAA